MSGLLVTPIQVAAVFGVTTKTLTHWEAAGALPRATRTEGGHRRWKAHEVAAVARAKGLTPPEGWEPAQASAA